MARVNSGKGVGLWPKLLLWGVVILSAFFYLRYINEKGSEGTPGAGVASRAQTAAVASTSKDTGEAAPNAPIEPATLSKSEEDGSKQPQSPVSSDAQSISESTDSAVAKSGAPEIAYAGATESSHTKSPQPGELTALATEASAMTQQSESRKEAVVESSSTPPSPPAPVAAGTDSAAPSAKAGATADSVPAETAPVAPSLPSEPKAQGERGAATSAQAQTQGPGEAPPLGSLQALRHGEAQKGKTGQESPVSGATPYQPLAASASALPGAPTSGWEATTAGPASESFQEQRARIVAEYQALRRERWELMREYREYMRARRRRSVPPYGFCPHYEPGYYRPWQ